MSETLTIVLSIAGINIALFAAIATLVVWAINKLDNDVKGMNNDVKTIASRLDGHASRIDQLYKMFVDLLAEKIMGYSLLAKETFNRRC